MSTTSKYITIIALAVLLAGIMTAGLLYGLKGVLALSGGGITSSADQAYLEGFSATTSASARSFSYDIQGVEEVTLFIGTAFDGEGTDEATFSVEVSDIPEPAQGAAIYGTTTPITRGVDNVLVPNLEFGTTSPFALAAGTYGTTTLSLDLRQHSYPFLRIIRTTDTEGRSTSTVSIIRKY